MNASGSVRIEFHRKKVITANKSVPIFSLEPRTRHYDLVHEAERLSLTDRWSSWSHSEAFSFPLGFTYRSFITALTWSTDGLFIAISLASTYTCVICEFPSQVPAILRPLFRFDKKPGTETPVINKTSGSSISLLTYLPIPTNKVSHMTCEITVIDWNELLQVILRVHFIILIRIFFFQNLRRIYAILFFICC